MKSRHVRIYAVKNPLIVTSLLKLYMVVLFSFYSEIYWCVGLLKKSILGLAWIPTIIILLDSHCDGIKILGASIYFT